MTAILLLVLAAQEDLSVLKPEDNPRKMVYVQLQGEAQKHFDARRKVVAELKTPADIRRRQEELRAAFIRALGGFPEKTPLNARVVGTASGPGVRVEKVIYESRPGHHVTGALYLPEGTPPFPGVLVPCGHSENGKASEAYQRVCILMARNGLAVLCYDPIGQGERKQLLAADGKAAIPGSTAEHTAVGVGALLVGRCAATYRIWDGIRSLDYLASRPEVDPKRLGCTGNSGGGTLTAYLMALDERIAAAAPSCYITTLERLFDTIGPQDAEQNIPGQVAWGMEHTDYVTMRAPRPTLICVGTQDYFDITGAWTTYREAKLLYGALGHGERVDLFEYNDKHGFSRPRREAATRWMRRWLLGKDDATVEPDFPVFPDAELQCTKSGQVLLDLKGRSAFDFNAEREGELARGRGKLATEDLLKEVRRRIAVEASVPAAQVLEGTETIRRSGYSIAKVRLATEPGVVAPALVFSPEKLSTEPPVLYVHGEGKAAHAAPGGPIEDLVKAGLKVVAVDVRGLGETAPGAAPARKAPDPYGPEWKEAFLATHVNRPLLGRRVHDLLAIVGRFGESGVHVVAMGSAGPAALHAAALDPRIRRVTIDGSVISWSAVVRTPAAHQQLANAVPGALEAYDLPDLAAAIAPRPLTIRGTVDAAGAAVPQAAIEEAYAGARAAYGSGGRLTLSAGR